MSRIFSGIQPSGDLHIGNYLGAVKNWVRLQDLHESIICIVDLHAITQAYDTSTFSQRTMDMAIGLLASGIDPDKTTLFVQSHVPQHSELMWLLNTVTPLGELERMTQFKDKSEKLESVPAGLLNYPTLQAADILLYKADLVPIGEDQLQHLELSREVARRFNARFGQIFPEPQPMLTEATRIIGLDGQAKMSKSIGNTIGLLDTPEAIWEKLRPAMTDPARKTKKDPGNPDICNMYALHRYFSSPEQVTTVAANCRSAAWGCIECKRVLADNITGALAPIRERAEALKQRPDDVRAILARGAERCRALADATLAEVRALMGFLPAKL